MPRISRYNHATKKLEWVDASPDEYQAWKDHRTKAHKASRAANKSKNAKAASSSTSETLEDDGAGDGERPAPSGPKRAAGGANTRPQSMLAPVLPRIAQSLVIGIRAATNNLTGGKAPMTVQEATAVAVPAIRIADRTAAQYIRKTGKVTANQEDAALIALTIVVWLVGWIVSSLQKKPIQAPSRPMPEASGDLFAGSEPVGPPPPAAPGQRSAPTPPGATAEPANLADDGDLFAGSEPIAPGGADAPAPIRQRVNPQQAALNERIWQAVTPTDMGETLAG